eukprot:m.306845 g.306845  ORF g.306845 m.306845 type:complete len:404 (+) comp41642_c0_seq1:131-1342(+)
MAGRCAFLRSTAPFALFVALVAGLIHYAGYRLVYAPEATLPAQADMLFWAYDVNRDGFIDRLEFVTLADRLSGNITFEFEDSIDPNQEVLDVEAFFSPLDVNSMKKSEDGLLFSSDINENSNLEGLRTWKKPHKRFNTYNAPNFQSFLPYRGASLGEVYVIVAKPIQFGNQINSVKYFPPYPEGREVLMHMLLNQFHRRPFVRMRFEPQGTIGLIRAENEEYVEIMFRCHAEFQLNEPPMFPFWFTPGQFTGHVIMKKNGSHVRHFKMFVPTNKSLNVDMEWMTGPATSLDPNDPDGSFQGNNQVDIGYMAEMRLESTRSSYFPMLPDENEEDYFKRASKEDEEIKWNKEISRQEALEKLERYFFPFKKVPYLPFKEAFSLAKAEQKLMHLIMLWGALDDQSC